MEALVTLGAEINVKFQRTTPLISAARTNDLSLVQCVLALGADPRLCTEHDLTALHIASGAQNLAMCQLLVQWGVPIDSVETNYGCTPLFSAISKDLVQYLLDSGATVDQRDYEQSTPLIRACSYGNIDKVRVLLDAGADHSLVDASDNSALHKAAQQYNIECMKLLRLHGATADLSETLTIAALDNEIEMVRYLLEIGVKVDQGRFNGETALMCVASGRFGETKTVHELTSLILHAGANVTLTGPSGKTALQLAQENPQREGIVDMLQVNPKVRLGRQMVAFGQVMYQLGFLGHQFNALSLSKIFLQFLVVPNNIDLLEVEKVATKAFSLVIDVYFARDSKVTRDPKVAPSAGFWPQAHGKPPEEARDESIESQEAPDRQDGLAM